MRHELEVAQDVARRAGAILRERFGGSLEISYKGPTNIVTDADRRSEALIRDLLGRAFPEYGFLGEEGGDGAGPSAAGARPKNGAPRWIVDPLDGTTNFAHGYPWFCVSIGLEEDGAPALGAVYNPVLDEMYSAEAGGGAWCNGRRLQVSDTAVLRDSLIASGFPYSAGESDHDNGREWQRGLKLTRSLRCDGSAALDVCHVAAGRVDGYWELDVEAWDIAAGVVLVQEAGGRVTNLAGGPVDLYGRAIVASNGALHAGLLEFLNLR